MAVPKRIDSSDVPESQMPSSSDFASRPIVIADGSFQVRTPYRYFNIAFLGTEGCGRNSLAWRMSNLNDSELPALQRVSHLQIIIDTSTRPALKHHAVIGLQTRIVPPDDTPPFFGSDGEIHRYQAVVFVVDLAEESSSNDFYIWYKKVKKSMKKMPPFLIVGNKSDLRLFKPVTPHKWGENTASLYHAKAYLECSAKTNEGVDKVLDAILEILL